MGRLYIAPMSSPNGQKLLRTAIQERAFAPAYLLYGEDDFLKERMVHELLDAALDPATRDFNLEIRRGAASMRRRSDHCSTLRP